MATLAALASGENLFLQDQAKLALFEDQVDTELREESLLQNQPDSGDIWTWDNEDAELAAAASSDVFASEEQAVEVEEHPEEIDQ